MEQENYNGCTFQSDAKIKDFKKSPQCFFSNGTIYFFDQTTKVPLVLANQENNHPVCEPISDILKNWVAEKFSSEDDIPIISNFAKVNAQEIMSKLKQEPRAFDRISRALVNVQYGHVFDLSAIDARVDVHAEDSHAFYQKYPLFCRSEVHIQTTSFPSSRRSPCQVIVAVQKVAHLAKNKSGEYYSLQEEVRSVAGHTAGMLTGVETCNSYSMNP
ncbi:hypothetical protein G9A89_012509 [Geosiphon pyriformis]|nr:hypothetical protein G9A89_012509 [Geosiphon pyriformis]